MFRLGNIKKITKKCLHGRAIFLLLLADSVSVYTSMLNGYIKDVSFRKLQQIFNMIIAMKAYRIV